MFSASLETAVCFTVCDNGSNTNKETGLYSKKGFLVILMLDKLGPKYSVVWLAS